MRSFLQSTVSASRITLLVFLGFLVVGLAPLWAEGDKEPKKTSGAMMPKGGGSTGIVNLPTMAQGNVNQASTFEPKNARIATEHNIENGGLRFNLPAGDTKVVASYNYQGMNVSATVQEGFLAISQNTLETMRASSIDKVNITFVAPDSRYLRVQLEFQTGSSVIKVFVE